jgi:hypothetical protein
LQRLWRAPDDCRVELVERRKTIAGGSDNSNDCCA